MGGDNETKIGLATIWAIGVGAALGGDFFGWQFVLYGGFGSAVAAVVFAASFYWLYAGAITELAARYRTSGGSFDFVKSALGRKAAALMAVFGLLKLILANSALALSISSYLIQGGVPSYMQLTIWIITYGSFTVLDIVGVRQSANVQVAATILCVFILILYAASCLTKFSFKDISQGGLVHDGAIGFFKGLPFALQFFDGFEEVPLLMAYAVDPETTIPRAILASYTTVSMIGIMVMISGSGITTSYDLLNSEAPLMDGIDAVYGADGIFSHIIAFVIVVGLVVNFFAFVLFTSQQVQAIAEAGQLPSFLAYRHPIHGAPVVASICSSIIGVILTAGFAWIFGEAGAQNTLVTAALMPAVLGYIVLLECIVRVRGVEYMQLSEKTSPRDTIRLGYDPGSLRFTYGAVGARIAQLMCIILAISLIILASVSKEFMYGLIILAVFGVLIYSLMMWFIRQNNIEEMMNIHRILSTDDDESSKSFLIKPDLDRPFQYNSSLDVSSGNVVKKASFVSMAKTTLPHTETENRSPPFRSYASKI